MAKKKKPAKKATKKATKKAAKKATKKAAKKATKKAVKKATKKVAKKATKKAVAAKPQVSAETFPILKVGESAPSFELKNQDGQVVKLNDFKGQNVVIYFYPKAMTPGCTVQACGLRDAKEQLHHHNIKIFGVSADPVSSLKKFQEKENLNFDLLSDESHSMIKAYGAWGLKQFMGKEFMGLLRISYLLDKEGKVAAVFSKVDTKTHAQDILNFYQTQA
jgi:peroxiredoxin Q/BCP